jgi:hypothetical protein
MAFSVATRAAAAVAITVVAAMLFPVPVTAAVPLAVIHHGCSAAAPPPPGLRVRTLTARAALNTGTCVLLLCALLCLKGPLPAVELRLFVVQRVEMGDL